jgi:copper homeostasis protein CutC
MGYLRANFQYPNDSLHEVSASAILKANHPERRMFMLLECCVDSVESAVAASENGADRLELCANLLIGGTTPDINLFYRVKRAVTAKINVLLRPRFGDYCYTDEEFAILLADVQLFREAGADGVTADELIDKIVSFIPVP